MCLLRLFEAIGLLFFQVHHQSCAARGLWQIATLLVGREANAGSIAGHGSQVRAVFDDGTGGGMLARATLFRQAE